MYKFQDYYYGDYYGEQDAYYAEEAPAEEEDIEMEEESDSVPAVILAYGLVPVLDIAAGVWNLSNWSDWNIDQWTQAYFYEIAIGAICLPIWGLAALLDNETVFPLSSKVHIALEAVALGLVWRAESEASADTNDSKSTKFSYFAHVFGLGYSAFAMSEIDAYWGDDVEEYAEEDEYYGTEEDGDD